jgi:hypothetical protein
MILLKLNRAFSTERFFPNPSCSSARMMSLRNHFALVRISFTNIFRNAVNSGGGSKLDMQDFYPFCMEVLHMNIE